MLPDLTSSKDIKFLINAFYKKAVADEVIGYIFTDIAKINLEEHLPTIYSFWESVLFGKASYKGNIISKHIVLHNKELLLKKHFDRWLELWNLTIDANFVGPKAEEAKTKADLMQQLMQFKISQSENPNFIQ